MAIVEAPAADGARPDEAGRPVPDRWASGRLGLAVACALPALVSLILGLWVLHLPHVLYGSHEYDDGVYMGAALRFAQGLMPYRDFVIVHPPGIVVLMTPAALLGRLFGTDTAMAVGRDLTVLVGAANVILAGAAVRHRGWRASLVAATALACFPLTPAATSTVLLEPYLVLFCLIGVNVLFRGGRLAPPRRVFWAGLAFGAGCSVKIWGGFVILAVLVFCGRRLGRSALLLVAGAAVAGGAICLPFFAAAPHAFLHDVLADQFQRVASGSSGLSWSQRIFVLSGLPGLSLGWLDAPVAVAEAVIGGGLLAGVLWARRDLLLPADWAVVGCAAGTVAPMWAASDIYPHYIYFPAPFLAGAAGLAVALATARAPGGGPARRRLMATLGRPRMLMAVAVLGAAFSIPQQAVYARTNLRSAADSSFLNLLIGPGQCVVSDDSSLLVTADLYQRPPAGCPLVVDAYGIFLASWPGHEPPSLSMGKVPVSIPQRGLPPASFVDEWAGWLSRADWVLQLSQISSYIPWTPELRSWFAHDFKLEISRQGLWVYRHVTRTPPPVAP